MAYPTDPIYKLIKNPMTGTVDQVKTKVGTHTYIIPFYEGNTDYETYLKWAKTNTAEAAD
mgnify:FL=1|tara:strand:+ start:1165 stop:1344 length:180 start_codon:yes stop_codon:yes gene_type:complete